MHQRCQSFLILLILSLSFASAVAADCADVVVQGQKLFVAGKEYFIKGFNYRPTPLGYASAGPDGTGGVGMCTPRKDVFGRNMSPCWNADYYHDYWKPVWDRDFPIMKDLDINTIRVSSMSPFEKTLTDRLKQANGGKAPKAFDSLQITDDTQAVSHRSFLDTAQQNNIKVILPIVETEDIQLRSTQQELQWMIEARVDALGDHPALLAWTVGEELQLTQSDKMATNVNWSIWYTRQYMKKKWNRYVPVTTVLFDEPTSYTQLAQKIQMDVVMANAGIFDVTENEFWNGNQNNGWVGWTALGKQLNKPVLISSAGFNKFWEQSSWPNKVWPPILANKQNGCIGGLFTSLTDDIQAPPSRSTMGVVAFQEQGGMQAGQLVPDQAIQRDTVYPTAKNQLAQDAFNGAQPQTISISNGCPAAAALSLAEPTKPGAPISISDSIGDNNPGLTGPSSPSSTSRATELTIAFFCLFALAYGMAIAS